MNSLARHANASNTPNGHFTGRSACTRSLNFVIWPGQTTCGNSTGGRLVADLSAKWPRWSKSKFLNLFITQPKSQVKSGIHWLIFYWRERERGRERERQRRKRAQRRSLLFFLLTIINAASFWKSSRSALFHSFSSIFIGPRSAGISRSSNKIFAAGCWRRAPNWSSSGRSSSSRFGPSIHPDQVSATKLVG